MRDLLSQLPDLLVERIMIRKLLLSLCLVVAAPLASFAADGAGNYVEGTDYDLITPALRTANPDKIEVVEFFWYGCGHCFTFEPVISQWKKTLPEDVEFHGSPAVWNDLMKLHARAYYTAEVLGVLDTMNPVLFQAMNIDKKRLDSQEEIEALFVANGVSAADFNKAFESFGVKSQVGQGEARARSAKITGTPEMMVAGKYRVTTRKSGSQAGMLKVADFLIARERAAKAQ
jgi:thiol:disulfide interchange protein DsbA